MAKTYPAKQSPGQHTPNLRLHGLRGFICVVLAAMLWPASALAEYRFNFPEPVTPVARTTLYLHNEFMIVIGILFIVVFAILCYSLVKHRKRDGYTPATFTEPHGKKQWLWTLFPFVLLLFIDYVLMGIPAVNALIQMENTKEKADMVVKVTGLQWKWQYEYPENGVKFVSTMKTSQDEIDNKARKNEHYLLDVDNPLVLPVGKKVRILLTSADVIHTWWVPQFGVKRDAIPGFLRETWVRVEKPGIYRGQCAELCGKGHGFMPIVVEALPEDEYNAWMKKQEIAMAAAAKDSTRTFSMDELMKKGQEVYAKSCQVCHQANGQGLPPAFPALAASKIVNGPLLSPEGELIEGSHVDIVLNGKTGTAMQAFKTTLSDIDLAAVVTYERNSFGNAAGDMIQPAQIKNLK